MKIFRLFLLLIIVSCNDDTIELPLPMEVIQLPNEMLEISGISYNNNNTILAHNDSGDDPNIYEVSLTEQKINRTIAVENADALDWEELTADDEFIYIGDFGNNLGGRENLTIYKINKNAVAIQDQVNADTISFYYPNQTDFTLRDTHNFDCEAMLIFENEIFLFTKNRMDFQTNWYTLPTTSGEYPAVLKNSFDSEGLITAAAINESKNVIALLGYKETDSDYDTFIWLLSDFSDDNIFDGKKTKIDLDLNEQLEAIDFQDDFNIIFTGEKENGGDAGLVYHLDIEDYLE